jgi:hypothetical protein
MPDELIDRIDVWSADQEDQPSRAESIRRLVEAGLKPHAFCLSDKKADEISSWAKKNGLSLHDAISSLVELGLKAKS